MNKEILSGLKRVDVSADEEKTKERVERIWKSSVKDLKRRVLDEYGISRNSVYRIFREGAITPKVTVIMASVFNVDPFYLTGEADEDEGYSEQALDRFLREKGYAELLDDIGFKPKRKYVRRDPGQGYIEPETLPNEDEPPVDILSDDIPNGVLEEVRVIDDENVCDPDIAVDLPEDELILMLRSLYVRARYNDTAQGRLKLITDTLLAD